MDGIVYRGKQKGSESIYNVLGIREVGGEEIVEIQESIGGYRFE